jgi:phage host-nuclease inhibitor protein Gam
MNPLSFEQRISLQMGDLIMEVKRLETIRDKMAEQLEAMAKQQKNKTDVGLYSASDAPST